MSDSILFEEVLKRLRDNQPNVTENDAKELWDTLIKYKSAIKDLAEEVENAAAAVKFSINQQKKKANAMDVETTGADFVRQVLRKLRTEKLDNINLYSSSNPGLSSVPGNSTKMVEEISKTSNARMRVIKHKEANPEMQTEVKTAHAELNFKFGQTLNRPFDVNKKIADFSVSNFMYPQPIDFKNSYLKRYEIMENKIKANKKIEFSRIEDHTKNFDTPTLILARLCYDEEDEFMTERVMAEMLSVKNKIIQCYLNFSGCNGEYHLFPNQYIAVEVQGDFYDKNSSLRVVKILEIGSEADEHDKEEPNASLISEYLNIMVFKGPFTQDGNAYFFGFDMIKHHILRDKSINCVVLVGPFVPEDQSIATTHVPELHSKTSFQQCREENILKFYEEVKKINTNIVVIIVPEISEADNIFPYPLPKIKMTETRNDLIMVSSPCLLEFEIKFNTYRVAIGSQDFLKNMMKFPHKSTDNRKFVQAMKSVISQRNLMPVFPLPDPFDVTNISLLDYDEDLKPHVFVACSNLTAFALKSRGVLICNPKTIFEGDGFGHCARIYLDANSQGVNGARVDVLKF